MSDIKQQLIRNELLTDLTISLIESSEFSLPLHLYTVTYQPLKRATMDILMKMILLTIQRVKFKDTAAFSQLLAVEPLFIEGILQLLAQEQLIQREEGYYTITARGEVQLQRGEFEVLLSEQQQALFYSPWHGECVQIGVPSVEAIEDFPPLFPYMKEQPFTTEIALQTLQNQTSAQAEYQEVITDVLHISEPQIYDIPYLSFVLYHKEEDIFYARVWDVLQQQWDQTLADALQKQQYQQWVEQV